MITDSATLQEVLLMRVEGEAERSHIGSLRPGDIVDFRCKLPDGPWSGEPWIVEEVKLPAMQLVVRRPFYKSEALYLFSFEVKLLARGKEAP